MSEITEIMVTALAGYWGIGPKDIISRIELKNDDAQPVGAFLVGPIRACLAALEKEGWVVVPREPTEEMSNEGWDAACAMVRNFNKHAPQAHFAIGGETIVWSAMVAAGRKGE